MKRKMIAVVSILILSAATTYGSGLTATLASYPININSQRIEATPLNVNGSTYLPVRTVSEALGVDIGWTGSSVEIQTVDVDKLKEACVMIYAENSTKGSQGSAVCWDYGEYLTAYHVVDNGQTNVRTSDGDKLMIDQTSEMLDIATLDATDSVKPIPIGDSDAVKVGDKVLIVGANDGKDDTVISTTVKRLTGDIVISKTLSGGGSGSAVFDMQGTLIAIVVASSVSASETYAVPINKIRAAL